MDFFELLFLVSFSFIVSFAFAVTVYSSLTRRVKQLEVKIEQAKSSNTGNPPINVSSSIRDTLPKLNPTSEKKTITLEIELPDLPERLTIPFSKIPQLLEVLREEKHEKGRDKGIHSFSFMGHYDKPWLDIISKVSGLEFSKDGERVYCPKHGWVPYIVASDGRIICSEGHETLWDPNKPKTYPVKELKEMNRELAKVENEIQELKNMSQLQPIKTIEQEEHKREIEEEEEPEEPIEEAEYEEE